MKLLKVSAISFFVFCSLFSVNAGSIAQAKTETLVSTPKVVQAEPVLLAKVNIRDAKIISQENNNFKLSFSISNESGVQNGVKYGVQLVEQSDKGQFILDEKVYDESLTLAENSTITKEISYSASSILSGKYKLFLVSKNQSGFPFGVAFLGDIKIPNLIEGVQVSPESCTISVVGDKSNTQYKIGQQASILPNQNLDIVCTAVNGSDKTIESTPSFVTTEKTSYGKEVSVNEIKAGTVTLKAKESKTFSVIIPKSTKPNLYYTIMSLKSGDVSSNSVSIEYVVRGTIVSIDNVSLNKDYYKSGDTANLSFVWTYMSNDTSAKGDIVLNTIITGKEGEECAVPYSQTLNKNPLSPKIEIPISINKDCYDPTVLVNLKDASGNTLDEKTFKTETGGDKTAASFYVYIIFVLIIILLIIGFIIYKKKKGNKFNMILPVIFLMALISVIPSDKVSADTYSIGGGNGSNTCTGNYTISLDKASYVPGEPVRANGYLWTYCNIGASSESGMWVSTSSNPTPILMLNSNGGTATQVVFGRGEPGVDHVDFLVKLVSNQLGVNNVYKSSLYYTVNLPSTTTTTPPATPKVDVNISDLNGALIPKSSSNITTQSIKPNTPIKLSWTATGFTGTVSCTLPNGSKGGAFGTITLSPGPSSTADYSVVCNNDVVSTPSCLGIYYQGVNGRTDGPLSCYNLKTENDCNNIPNRITSFGGCLWTATPVMNSCIGTYQGDVNGSRKTGLSCSTFSSQNSCTGAQGCSWVYANSVSGKACFVGIDPRTSKKVDDCVQ